MGHKRPLPRFAPAVGAVALNLALLLMAGISRGAADEGVGPPDLLIRLPDSINTPDGAALAPNGDIILSVPNFNNDALMKDQRIATPAPERMVRIDGRNELTT